LTAESRRRWARVDTAGAIILTAATLVALALLLLGGRSIDLAYYGRVTTRYDRTVAETFVRAALLAFTATATAFAAGLLIGFLVGLARTAAPRSSPRLSSGARPVLRFLGRRSAGRLADFYVELIRGTPLLVQILFIWSVFLVYAPSDWDLGTRSLAAGVLAMTVNTGAYQGEIFRGAFQAVPATQVEAARAVGLTRVSALRHIVLPQALRLAIPPLTNEFSALFKASSLLFLIGVAELTSIGTGLRNSDNTKVFEVFLALIAAYLAVTLPLGRLSGYLERHFRIPGLGTPVREPLTGRGPSRLG